MNSSMKATQRGLGMAAAVSTEVVRITAVAAQQAGYHSFWLNNPPGASALQTLGGVARLVPDMSLGVGVIPLTDQHAEEIARVIRRHELPVDRFYLGIGSGSGTRGVARVAEGVRVLRSELDCFIMVAALGPRMSRLAGEVADGVLFNWLTPEHAGLSAAWVREGAERAGRLAPRIMAYVRTALGGDAIARLQCEADRYQAVSHYADHFSRMGVTAMDTAVSGADPAEIQRGLAAWDGVVDEVVVRVITANDTAGEVLGLLQAAAPARNE